ncbi:MAG TPA: BTAD domain-containing putative transcriptional regulator [Geodermatophilus sp.]|nr:BTAD domain-containing putative transcriptional regulator [Geodermatophilus sp.]
MMFRVLGPLEVEVGSERIALPGQRPGALLVALLLQPNTAVPTDRLVDLLWGDDPPEDPSNALHQVVRRLRARLGPAGAAVVTRGSGYALATDRSSIDAERFEAGCREARRRASTDPAAALAMLEEALTLWRGRPFGEFADGFARAPATRLEELRLAALEDRAELLLACGAATDAVAAARDLAGSEPLRPRPVEILMRALSAEDRSAEALEVYRRHRELLADELGLDPPETLRDLESRILRGEAGPPGLARADRNPPRAWRAPAPPVQSLPWRPGPILGREMELDLLLGCLRTHRLVTLVGPGGVGKTRLALEAAHVLAGSDSPVWWADLSAVSPSRVVDAVAEATAVEIQRGADPAGGLAAALGAHRGVLCLDNAETVLDALAPVVERLVASAPEVAVLATSRERLSAAQEHVHPLPPLPVPSGAGRENAAVRLFVERAPGLEPDRLSDDDVAVIAATCQQLDGLPLAIELGAARAATFGLRDFAARLHSGLDLLAGGRRTAAERHRSVRAVVDWSYRLLTEDEALLFLRLGVFPGSFDLDQVESVCADDRLPRSGVAALLARLVEQSLVQGGGGRFRLLETLRAYARSRLDPAEQAALRARHAADTADRLVALNQRLWSPEMPEAVAAIAALSADLHAAWAYAAEHDRPLAVRLAADVMDYAYERQRLDLLEWGLTVAGWDVEHPRLPDALAAAAAAAWAAGRLDESERLARRGVAAAGGFGVPAAARSVNQCACLAMFHSRDDAVPLFRQNGALHRVAGEEILALQGEISVNQALTYAGGAAEATAAMGPLLERARASGNPSAIGWAYYVLGESLADADPEGALAAYAACVEHSSKADNRLDVMLARSSAVALAADRGAPEAGLQELRHVMDQWEQLGNAAAHWWVLLNVVILLSRIGAPRDAAVLAGAIIAKQDEHPAFARDRKRLEDGLAGIRQTLGEEATEEALAEGAALPFPAAVAHARRSIERAGAALADDGSDSAATPR